MSAIRKAHVSIEGRVQGVGYRAWVETTALALDLSGWVRNRHDGSVEAVFQGPPGRVADMLGLCEQGPPSARVTRVIVLGEVADAHYGFEVRTTV